LTQLKPPVIVAPSQTVAAASSFLASAIGVHTRVVGLDRDTNKELLLKHIRKSGEKGTPFKELEQVLPSHSRNQIRVLVRELQQADRIYVVGKAWSARWFSR